MEDIIDYKVPFGLIGQIVHPFIVKKQLQKIFQYRENKLKNLFGSLEGHENNLELKAI